MWRGRRPSFSPSTTIRITVKSSSPGSELPGGEEELRGEVQRPHPAPPTSSGSCGEEADVAQHAHPVRVAGVAQRLLDHRGDLDRAQQGPQAVGVEGLEGADAGEVHRLDLGEGGQGHQLAEPLEARRAGVLLEHVDGGEHRLELERPHRAAGRPPTKQTKSSTRSSSSAIRPRMRLLHPGATPQSTMAIRPRSRASPSRRKGSSSKKEMSTMSLPLRARPSGWRSPGSRGRRPPPGRAPDGAATAAGSARSARSVRSRRPWLARLARLARRPQRLLGSVHHRHLESRVARQVPGHGAPHPSAPQNHDLHAGLLLGTSR